MACSRQPEVLWAQRSEKIYLTISLPDAKDVVLKTEPQGLFSFSAVANGEPFSFTLELFDSVLPEVSRSICGFQFWIEIWACTNFIHFPLLGWSCMDELKMLMRWSYK